MFHFPQPQKVLKKSARQSKTLLEMPDEVIELILDQLNFEDRMNFTLACKKVNRIISEHSKYWKKVWLKIQESIEPSEELTRRYSKVAWQCNKSPKVHEEIWKFLAPSLKVLVITIGNENIKDDHQLLPAEKNLKAALPLEISYTWNSDQHPVNSLFNTCIPRQISWFR